MAKERDAYLDTMEDLIGHPGWRILEGELKQRIMEFKDMALDPRQAKTWDEINILRGAAQQLAEFLALPQTLENLRAAKEEGE